MALKNRNNANFTKKEKFDAKSFKRVLSYCKPVMTMLVISLVCAIIGNITTIIGPQKVQDLINVITNGIATSIDMTAFVQIAVFLICLYSVGALFNYLQQFLMAIVTQKTSKKLRTDINLKINKLPLAYFDKTTKGDILSRVTNDVDTISQTLGSSIANLISSVVLFFGVIIMMFVTNWILALVTIATSLFGFLFLAIILKKSQKYFNKRQIHIGELNGQVEETYSNYNVVKSYNAVNNEKIKFEKSNDEICKVVRKAEFMSSLMPPIMSFVGDLAYVLIFVVGVSIIISGGTSVTIGTLIAFVMYARLFSQPLRTFAQSLSSIQQASAASKRVFEILDEKELEDERNKTKTLSQVKGDVEFKNVKFGYNKDRIIIKNFSAKLKSGQKVAIVGPTGAGKTTIVNLLMRFYEINSGDILIDGISTKDITRENVHDLFDMILQDTWVFDGTIRENLVYNKEGVTDEKLNEVCNAVGLSHFINTLPNGYDTRLSDVNALSEGQKQQLTIARAMIKDSPLLILDEATSNVDTRTELIIQKAMDELTKDRTSFVIAHRLSTIRDADIILVMKDGDIVEQGTHNELLEKKGFYAELYNSQFADVG